MKTKLFKVLPLFFIFCLSSCKEDVYTKRIYLASKYTLKYAAYIENYTPNIGVAYFKKLPIKENYINCFDLEKSIAEFNVKIIDGKPNGFANIKIFPKNNEFTPYDFDFDYNCNYSSIYGNDINYLNTDKKPIPEGLGVMVYRCPNWFIRFEMYIPELTNNKIIFEYQFIEDLGYPEEFTHNYW